MISVWQVGRGRFFVPVDGQQIVPNDLFVVAVLGGPGLVDIGPPEAGRIRGEDLVDEQQPVVFEAELELGIGQQKAFGFGQGQGPAIQGQADVPDLFGQ